MTRCLLTCFPDFWLIKISGLAELGFQSSNIGFRSDELFPIVNIIKFHKNKNFTTTFKNTIILPTHLRLNRVIYHWKLWIFYIIIVFIEKEHEKDKEAEVHTITPNPKELSKFKEIVRILMDSSISALNYFNFCAMGFGQNLYNFAICKFFVESSLL